MVLPDDIMGDLLLPDRSTVKETYEQAISDLKKAEEMMTINKGAAYASKEAAQAMLSRVYLYMSGTYENPNRRNMPNWQLTTRTKLSIRATTHYYLARSL